MSNLVVCPKCEGDCSLVGVAIRGAAERGTVAIELPCPQCNGVGKVLSEMLDWIKHGKAIRDRREALGYGLRGWSDLLGVKASRWSAVECGTVNNLKIPALFDLYIDITASEIAAIDLPPDVISMSAEAEGFVLEDSTIRIGKDPNEYPLKGCTHIGVDYAGPSVNRDLARIALQAAVRDGLFSGPGPAPGVEPGSWKFVGAPSKATPRPTGEPISRSEADRKRLAELNGKKHKKRPKRR